MLLNREALLVLDTADTSLTSLSDDLADRLSEARGSLPERCREDSGMVTSHNTESSYQQRPGSSKVLVRSARHSFDNKCKLYKVPKGYELQ